MNPLPLRHTVLRGGRGGAGPMLADAVAVGSVPARFGRFAVCLEGMQEELLSYSLLAVCVPWGATAWPVPARCRQMLLVSGRFWLGCGSLRRVSRTGGRAFSFVNLFSVLCIIVCCIYL